MSNKKVFKVDDKIFAKIPGYPAWPALVTGVKCADTPSKTEYSIYLYGIYVRAECKPEDLFPYEENKLKLGKPNEHKHFVEALSQIEMDSGAIDKTHDDSESILTLGHNSPVKVETPQETLSNVVESIDKTENEPKSTIDESKDTERKLSDIKPDGPSIKPTPIEPKTSESSECKDLVPIILVKKLKDFPIEKTTEHKTSKTEDKTYTPESIPDGQTNDIVTTSETTTPDETITEAEAVVEKNDINLDSTKKTENSVVKVKNAISTSTSELLPSDGSNVGQVSHSDLEIKLKRCSNNGKDSKGPKRLKMSKENSNVVKNHNSSISLNDHSLEENGEIEDSGSSSETRTMSQTQPSAPLSPIITTDAEVKNMNNTVDKVNEDAEVPKDVKEIVVESIGEVGSEKNFPNKLSHLQLLHIEVEMLGLVHKLRNSLRVDYAYYELAIDTLNTLDDLQISAMMLKKNSEVVEIIKQVTKYAGNIEKRSLTEKEIQEHRDKITQVRCMAISVYTKFMRLFTVPDDQSFYCTFLKEVDDFNAKTKNLSAEQIFEITSDEMCK